MWYLGLFRVTSSTLDHLRAAQDRATKTVDRARVKLLEGMMSLSDLRKELHVRCLLVLQLHAVGCSHPCLPERDCDTTAAACAIQNHKAAGRGKNGNSSQGAAGEWKVKLCVSAALPLSIVSLHANPCKPMSAATQLQMQIGALCGS